MRYSDKEMDELDWPGLAAEESPGRYAELEERTFEFARRVRLFIKRLTMTLANIEDAKQLVRASGSVGANYIEANESLGRRDFLLHIKISRKEAKESRYWLRLLDLAPTADLETERQLLIQESTELMCIFGAIYRRAEQGTPARKSEAVADRHSDEAR